MRRREFIVLIGGAATALPVAARAQKSSSVRHVSVLMSTASDDSLGQAWIAAFAQGLQQLGWEIGSNIRIDYRWGAGDTERFPQIRCGDRWVIARRDFGHSRLHRPRLAGGKPYDTDRIRDHY